MFKGREGEWLQKLSTKALFTLSGITCCAFICSHTNISLSCFISYTKHCSFNCLILELIWRRIKTLKSWFALLRQDNDKLTCTYTWYEYSVAYKNANQRKTIDCGLHSHFLFCNLLIPKNCLFSPGTPMRWELSRYVYQMWWSRMMVMIKSCIMMIS